MRKTPLPLIYTILLLVAAVAIAALALSLSAAGTQPTVYRVVSIKPTHYHPVSLTTLEVRLRDLHTRHLAQAARARRLLLAQRAAERKALVTTTTTVPTYIAPVTTTTEPYYDYATTTTTQPYVAPTYSGDGYVDPSSLPWPWSCIVRVESGGTNAQNPYSSASGYFQFLDSTWTAVSGLPAPASAYSFAEQYAVAQSASLSNWTDGC